MDIGRRDNTPKPRYTTEQIIGILREADVLLGQGQMIGQASRGLGASDHTTTGGGKSMAAFGRTRRNA